MKIKVLEDTYSVMRYEKMPEKLPGMYFSAVTDDEVSILCKADEAPENATNTEGRMRGFRIEGSLDFSLIGIIARITAILADNDVSVFVVSSFKTDYFFVREENLPLALQLLEVSGYEIL